MAQLVYIYTHTAYQRMPPPPPINSSLSSTMVLQSCKGFTLNFLTLTHITWWNVDNDEVCKSYETLYSIECCPFCCWNFHWCVLSNIIFSQDINLSQCVYLDKMTKSHNSCKTCSIAKSTLYGHLHVMLLTVQEYEHNPSRGVGGVAHTRFRDVRT